MNSITRYIVTAVDSGETCSGKAIVLKACKTFDEAKEFVKKDIESWQKLNSREGCEVDFNSMRGWFDYNTSDGCEWQISEVKIEL